MDQEEDDHTIHGLALFPQYVANSEVRIQTRTGSHGPSFRDFSECTSEKILRTGAKSAHERSASIAQDVVHIHGDSVRVLSTYFDEAGPLRFEFLCHPQRPLIHIRSIRKPVAHHVEGVRRHSTVRIAISTLHLVSEAQNVERHGERVRPVIGREHVRSTIL
ncbi:MAG: hypothetical protein IPN30_06420 [Flavobacteriales bacterium]|nr:hypothetical protein [Flavobacteriales bacterium]